MSESSTQPPERVMVILRTAMHEWLSPQLPSCGLCDCETSTERYDHCLQCKTLLAHVAEACEYLEMPGTAARVREPLGRWRNKPHSSATAEPAARTTKPAAPLEPEAGAGFTEAEINLLREAVFHGTFSSLGEEWDAEPLIGVLKKLGMVQHTLTRGPQ